MRQLYLLRHALAAEPGEGKDADRPLTDKGRKRMKDIGRAIARMELGLELILASPYERARQTAQLLVDALKSPPPLIFTESLQPEMPVQKALELMDREYPTTSRIALVGHEPHLSHFTAWLLTGRADGWLDLKKAGLISVSCQSPGNASLHFLLTPSQLESM